MKITSTLLLMILPVLLICRGSSPNAAQTPGALTPTQSGVYYVAPTGVDENLGTQDYPWRTIQKAADTLVAGQTVYIRAGVYAEQVIPKNSGSSGNVITYAAYPGESVTIDGSGVNAP